MKELINREAIVKEVVFKTSRSSGKGGQHVNKVATRVEAFLDILHASCFTVREKKLILKKLASKISQAGVLQVVAQEERSQLRNKERAIEKMMTLLARALKPVKRRKATKPTAASQKKRLKKKTEHSIKKENRRKPFPDD